MTMWLDTRPAIDQITEEDVHAECRLDLQKAEDSWDEAMAGLETQHRDEILELLQEIEELKQELRELKEKTA